MSKKNKEIIDLGEWKVPSDWNQITLKQFQEIERMYGEKEKKFDAREVLHILCNKTIDEVNQLPMEIAEKIMEKLLFLQDAPNYGEPSPSITVNGVKYTINVMEKLKTGEYIAIDTILKSDKTNFAAILAVLCRKDGEIYDSKFEAETLDSRIEMFEKVPMLDAMPIVNFFLNLYIGYVTPSQLSSAINEELKSIRQSIIDSRANGELSARSTKSLMKKLKKLEKSINSI